jgi:hypothetical protein
MVVGVTAEKVTEFYAQVISDGVKGPVLKCILGKNTVMD